MPKPMMIQISMEICPNIPPPLKLHNQDVVPRLTSSESRTIFSGRSVRLSHKRGQTRYREESSLRPRFLVGPCCFGLAEFPVFPGKLGPAPHVGHPALIARHHNFGSFENPRTILRTGCANPARARLGINHFPGAALAYRN